MQHSKAHGNFKDNYILQITSYHALIFVPIKQLFLGTGKESHTRQVD